MEWYWIVLIVVASQGIALLILMGWILYSILLVRTSKKKWVRGMSMPEDEEYNKLFKAGQEWREKNLDKKKDVHIKSGRLNLYGEYFDFGCDKAVIILPGRMETCLYSDFFALPYEEAGCNVLTIDNRAHGLSDGHFNSLGYHESKDLLEWAKLLHDEMGNKKIFLHGVCIGSSCASMALTRANCPDYIVGMVGEGMYTCFNETFLTHMKDMGHQPFPMGYMAMFELFVFTGYNPYKDGPKKRLPMLKRPILMIHSKEDIYSLPEKAQELYDSILTEDKELVWFEHGSHSKIRIYNEEQREHYDEVVRAFVKRLS